ncbi:sulfotransferase family protein [Actinomadura spongiicola]|uniref:Sulfotransferase family protein n=1 Tax=Actinomadura spongiicola TaxID=2303421 RepID=A0A372GHR3_9ACTN|nr:sulfotransferase family protein [Actinomadura spongiicola]RFS84916.1 sulfotransferase family protein [Actinomadura spongiicola]
MQVIGAGFGRTGTASLKAALERLDLGPCYHMSTVIAEPHRVRQWLDIGECRPPDWDEIFTGFQSALDWPAASYWRELAAHYPNAKVILTIRDRERWYDSVASTIFARALAEHHRPPLHRRLVRWLVARRSPDFALYPRMARATIMDRVFDGRIDDRDHVLTVFDRHIAEVKAAIPPDRLLIFDVRQGWPPLCDFLDVPTPNEPFPESNERTTWHRKRPRRLLQILLHGR